MMRFAISALCIVACAAGSFQDRKAVQDVHPIVKVIDMLEKLKAESENQGQLEEIAYTKFDYWCKTSKSALNADIDTRKKNIDMLTDSIEAKTGQIKVLKEQIKELEDELAAKASSKAAAIKTRETDNEAYIEANQDYTDTIKAIKDCLTELEKAQTTTEAAALLKVRQAQKHVREILGFLELKATSEQMLSLNDFLSNAVDPMADADSNKAKGDYEKHVDVYKFKSGSVIDLLRDLLLKFEDAQTQGTTEETNSANAHTLMITDLDNAVTAAELSKGEKEGILATTKSELEQAVKDKKAEVEELESSEATLKATTETCDVKASEWKERSEIRTNEIAALTAAAKILSKVTGVETEAPSNPVLVAPSFFQKVCSDNDHKWKFKCSYYASTGQCSNEHVSVRCCKTCNSQGIQKVKAEALALIRHAAKEAHSRSLERLAVQIEATNTTGALAQSGVFNDIINSIQKMVFQLEKEQIDEDTHKSWCDLQIEKTDTSISDKNLKIEELAKSIEALKAIVAQLKLDVKKNSEDIVALNTKMKEMAEIRAAGKAENLEAIKDAQAAQEAIASATAVVEQFYKSSGAIPKQPWEFMQKAKKGVDLPANPATWDSSYTGVGDPDAEQPQGIVTLLSSVGESFSKMEAETKAQDAQDEELFKNEKSKAEIELAGLAESSTQLTQEMHDKNDKIESLAATEKHVKKELDAWSQYKVDLQPACVEGTSDYETRKGLRKKEIEALHQAEDFLKKAFDKKAAVFLQVKPHRQ